MVDRSKHQTIQSTPLSTSVVVKAMTAEAKAKTKAKAIVSEYKAKASRPRPASRTTTLLSTRQHGQRQLYSYSCIVYN